MVTNNFSSRIWDRLGVLLSLGCAVHCLVLGLLPRIVECASQTECCHDCGEWSVHQRALVLVMIVATMAVCRCCMMRDRLNFARLLTGLALLWGVHLSPALGSYESVLTPVGAILVAWAHWRNLRENRGQQ